MLNARVKRIKDQLGLSKSQLDKVNTLLPDADSRVETAILEMHKENLLEGIRQLEEMLYEVDLGDSVAIDTLFALYRNGELGPLTTMSIQQFIKEVSNGSV